jgi:hypothetical protein
MIPYQGLFIFFMTQGFTSAGHSGQYITIQPCGAGFPACQFLNPFMAGGKACPTVIITFGPLKTVWLRQHPVLC